MKLPGLILALAFAATLAAAEPYKAGDKFEGFACKDQHEKDYSYVGGARRIVVAFEMGSGKAANAYFEKQPAAFLDQEKTLFISNIHGMPGIGRMFALPKMKKYPHRILLADSENFLVRYPRKEDHLTVLTLDDAGKVTAVDFVNPKKAMAEIFAGKK
ncbi:MAG: hypothetical protein JNL39_21790 [Opitutaceae bacterium]|nr:hypothetical protein [Opitutaceae bacterium]